MSNNAEKRPAPPYPARGSSRPATESKRFCLLLLLSYLVPWLYAVLSQFWGEQGGASSSLNSFEFPYLVLLGASLYFSDHQPRRLATPAVFLPPLTILGLYALYDLFYMYYKRSPRLSDFANYPALSHVSLLLFLLLTLYLLLLLVPTAYGIVRWYRRRPGSPRSACYWLLARAALVAVILLLPFSNWFWDLQQTRHSFDGWSETRNVQKNGRIASFIYYQNKRQEVLQKMAALPAGASYELLFAAPPQERRNIHIIILESFMDPRLIKGLRFTTSPLSSELVPFLPPDQRFSLVRAPVYGGGSPQSEFEILTGLPALGQIASTEFNVFEGGETPSLIRRLKQFGYHTMVAKGSRPGFYNSTNAYRGLGFDEIHYRGKSYYRRAAGDEYLFDGELLSANLEYLANHFFTAERSQPVLNYVVGMYGHLPFGRNLAVRPDQVETPGADTLLHNLANQFYYRTEALGLYLKGLQQVDPDALVFITGDHLPPIFQKGRQYLPGDFHLNAALLLDRFQPVAIDNLQLHQVSRLLWSRLAGTATEGGPHQEAYSPELLEEIYQSLMRSATGLSRQPG